MANQLAFIDALHHLQEGYVAGIYGQFYDVRRIDGSTNTSVANNAPVISGLNAMLTRTTSKITVEGSFFEVICYVAEVNRTLLNLGDLLTETGFEAMPTSYYMVQARPLKDTILIRADASFYINRPLPEGGQAAQVPAPGAATNYLPYYSGDTVASEGRLTLVNGSYSFTQAGNAIPALVPCGLQPVSRASDATSLGTPTDTPRNRFTAYIPLLPGVQLFRKDRLNDGTFDYEIISLYSSGLTGLSGYTVILEQLGA